MTPASDERPPPLDAPITAPLTFTPRERDVLECMAIGCDYDRIARTLGMAPKTAAVHVSRIAAKLPNPERLKGYTLVLLYAAHQYWLMERFEREAKADAEATALDDAAD